MALMNIEEFINCKVKITIRCSPDNVWHGILNSINDEYIELLSNDGNRIKDMDRILIKEIVAISILDIEDKIIKQFEQTLVE